MLSHSELILRLVTAAVLGAAVGLERERLEWAAGLRTHMLVCLGSCLLMIVSAFGFADVLGESHVVLDPSRVAAQVVSGIGFLGAGTILFLRQKVIRGLTTAASLWTIAAVGLAVGGGLLLAAVTTTVIVLVILAVVKPLERRIFQNRRYRQVTVVIARDAAPLSELQAVLENAGARVMQLTLTPSDDEATDRVVFNCSVTNKGEGMLGAVTALRAIAGVRTVKL
jgi:putative Mg2+ transporter-C (MgtC) family protein